MNTTAFWMRIKSLSKEKHVTQKDVAKAIGMPAETYKKWVSKAVIPSLDYTIELSRYFGVSIQFLVFGKELYLSAELKEARFSLKVIDEKLKEIQRSLMHAKRTYKIPRKKAG